MLAALHFFAPSLSVVFPVRFLRSPNTLASFKTLRYSSSNTNANTNANANRSANPAASAHKSSSLLSGTLRLLQWDKLCDSVASFAATSLGREATKAQLWSTAVDVSYGESVSLLAETNAAVEMMKYGIDGLDFTGFDTSLVKSAIKHASRGLAMGGLEAIAVAGLLEFVEILQSSMKAAFKGDADWYQRFMPLSEMAIQLVTHRHLVRCIQQAIDEDGSVKDSASSDLKRSRDQVRMLEKKLHQAMDDLIRKENDTSSLEVCNVDGRLCFKSGSQQTALKGLLLYSGSGAQNIIEPIAAVPLNDELQRARASVKRAEQDVLSNLTAKMHRQLDDIRNLLDAVIRLDVVVARAKYSLTFGGTCPVFSDTRYINASSILQGNASGSTNLDVASLSYPNKKEWRLYLRKAHHPLLVQQHKENLQKAKKDVGNVAAEIRRRKLQGEYMTSKENLDAYLASLETQVTRLEDSQPVPVDFLVSDGTRVLVITGPNTGGKTISLKTVGLAALMSKSGLYVLASEPAKIPWFDGVFADIGDEQSLVQSLSTFSGHLKRISAIRAWSTSNSLVLLDEVGAGTNPLEGAALGMSILEDFAETGALLTVATTHHGELKTLKYSNAAFENACVEFDEVKLKPTYKILWGVPGRSNAINIAERLGLPQTVLDRARELYGTTSAEIDGIILDMERLKQEFRQQTHETRTCLMQSRQLHEKLLAARKRILEHIANQRYRKIQEISQTAVSARSNLHSKLRLFRASETQQPQNTKIENDINNGAYSVKGVLQPPQEKKIPEVGDTVCISSLQKRVKVLRVEASKGEVLVKAGNMQLRLKLREIEQVN